MRNALTAALAAALVFALALPAQAMECAGVRMPNRITVDGTPLVLNGLGLREATAFNVDVYVAGLYLENRSRDARQILASEQKKRLVLQLVRDVGRDEMVEALREGLGSGANTPQARRLMGWIPELEEGDTVAFTYTPGEGLEVSVKGRVRGTLEGAGFARQFFGIWLGSSPADGDLKRGLIGGGCG